MSEVANHSVAKEGQHGGATLNGVLSRGQDALVVANNLMTQASQAEADENYQQASNLYLTASSKFLEAHDEFQRAGSVNTANRAEMLATAGNLFTLAQGAVEASKRCGGAWLALRAPIVETIPNEYQATFKAANETLEKGQSVSILTEIQDWLFPVAKGGPGSGENPGHPFRGNGSTGGVPAGSHHNEREHAKNFDHGQHLEAAATHTALAKQAMAEGKFAKAGAHFDEASYHGARAAQALQTAKGAFTNSSLGQKAEAVYHAVHTAGNDARLASKAMGDYTRAVKAGADSQTLRGLKEEASRLTSVAHNSAADADHANASADRVRTLVSDPTLSRASR